MIKRLVVHNPTNPEMAIENALKQYLAIKDYYPNVTAAEIKKAVVLYSTNPKEYLNSKS